MKGRLDKTEQGWVVEYPISSFHSTLQQLPLHPDDVNLMPLRGQLMNDQHIMNGKEVEFEIINETYDDGKGCVYAKLIPSKEQQKQLITEIMDLDAKDGLYGYPELEGTMAVCNHVINKRKEPVEDDVDTNMFYHRNVSNPYPSETPLHIGYKKGFQEGYNFCRETLYTEEQVRKAFEYGKGIGGLNLKDDFEQYIQSLKQPKIDIRPMTQEEMNEIRNPAYKYFDIDDTVNDTVSELNKLAEKTFKGDDATTFVQREIWKDGYRKAKETLYTEEQVREAIDIARKGTVTDAYGDLEVLYSFEKEEIIQSLKQPK